MFAAVMLTVGRALLAKLGERVERAGRLNRDAVALVLLLVIAAGWFTDHIGIFSVFGGFVTGLAMPKTPVLTTAAAMPIYRGSLPDGMDQFVPERPRESTIAAS